MKYKVEYKNPNDVFDRVRVFETRRKAELNKFLAQARKYDGSYNILSAVKISEAKNKKNKMESLL